MRYKRLIQDQIFKNLANDFILVIIGARQTGKTTLLKIIKNELENRNQETFFLNLERMDYLALLNQDPENLFKIIPQKKEKICLLIDEVQYLDNPTNFLKYIYDEYKEKIK